MSQFEYDELELDVGESEEVAAGEVMERLMRVDLDAEILQAQESGDQDRLIGFLLMKAYCDVRADDAITCTLIRMEPTGYPEGHPSLAQSVADDDGSYYCGRSDRIATSFKRPLFFDA